jgi:predicted DNA-binding transcriptional regulator AlpA
MTATIRTRRLPEACETTGMGTESEYALQSGERNPTSIEITAQAVGGIEHEVQTPLVERIDQTRAHPEPSNGPPSVGPTEQRARKREY